MDIIYVVGPGLVTLLFTYIWANTDEAKHPVLRLLFFFFGLTSLMLTTYIAQTVSVYGEIVPQLETTTYAYNATGVLMNATTSYNTTHLSPVTDASYDFVWLIITYSLWILMAYTILSLFGKIFNEAYKLVFKKDTGMDEIG